MSAESGNGRIFESIFRGKKAYVMESEALRLIVVPECGGHIVSLQNKETEKEWLVQAPHRKLRESRYGDPYGLHAMYGWDECFPTIIACAYPEKGKHEVVWLPDHGELWALPWSAEVKGNELYCKVSGKAIPYTFSRTLAFTGMSRVRFSYEVRNESSEVISAVWTAHPLLAATENTEIRVSPEVTRMLCVDGGKHFEQGRFYDWKRESSGLHAKMNSFGSPSEVDSRKFYADSSVRPDWCGLYERDTGDFITLSWSQEELPFFGIWTNEGQFNGQLACALEPANGYYDELGLAVREDKRLQLQPGAAASWSIEVTVGLA